MAINRMSRGKNIRNILIIIIISGLKLTRHSQSAQVRVKELVRKADDRNQQSPKVWPTGKPALFDHQSRSNKHD